MKKSKPPTKPTVSSFLDCGNTVLEPCCEFGKSHRDGFFVSQCHESGLSFIFYTNGILNVSCGECGNPMFRVMLSLPTVDSIEELMTGKSIS